MNININPPHFFSLSVLLMIFLNCLSSPCRIDILEVFWLTFLRRLNIFIALQEKLTKLLQLKVNICYIFFCFILFACLKLINSLKIYIINLENKM